VSVTVAILVGIILLVSACYHCKTPDCSDLPPEPDPFARPHDAGTE
jgi:hypothetical protein